MSRQAKSAGEETLWLWLDVFQPGLWQREFRFHETRRWRFDFAREDIKLAVEFDGLLYRGGLPTVCQVLRKGGTLPERLPSAVVQAAAWAGG